VSIFQIDRVKKNPDYFRLKKSCPLRPAGQVGSTPFGSDPGFGGSPTYTLQNS
jgi:hypothetical protein